MCNKDFSTHELGSFGTLSCSLDFWFEILVLPTLQEDFVFVDFLKGRLFVFFCFVPVRSTKLGCFRLHSCLFGKLLRRRGASAWFHGIWTCSAKVFEYWMIFSLKIKLNCSWKFQRNWKVQKFFEYWMIFSLKIKLNCSWKFWRNWNVPLLVLERSWWAGFNGIYLVRFCIQNVGDIDFKVITTPENSNKLPKTRFTIQFKHDFLSYLAVQKIEYRHCKTMFTCWVSLFCNGFTLGPMAQATLVEDDDKM